MLWNPIEHSDDDNLRWSLLRATEWLNWPVFLSQVFAPFILLWFSWKAVLGVVFVCNYLWAFFVRYRVASVSAADLGVLLTKLKWVICPSVAAYLWFVHDRLSAMLALLWPILLLVVPLIPIVGPIVGLLIIIPGKTGRVQAMFMARLGYERQYEHTS